MEPGEIRVGVGGASDRLPLRGSFLLHGAERTVGADRVLDTLVVIRAAARTRCGLRPVQRAGPIQRVLHGQDVLHHVLGAVRRCPGTGQQRPPRATARGRYSVIDPQAAATARVAYDGLTGFLSIQLKAAQGNGELPGHLDTHRAARYLCAVVEGLCVPTLIGACTPDQALAVLDDHLAMLFG